MKKILLVMAAFFSAAVPAAASNIPSGVTLTFDGANIEIEWRGLTDTALAQYSVSRAESLSGPYTVIASGISVTKHTDALPDTAAAYFYRVQADVSGTTGPASAPLGTYPYPPAQKKAAPYNSKVYMSWEKSADTAVQSYRVFKSDNPAFETAGFVTVPNPEYLDLQAVNGKTAFYWVRSYNGLTQGARSVPVVVVPFAPPHSVRGFAASVTNGAVALSWTGRGIEGTYPIEGFKIYRGETFPVSEAGFIASVTGTSYTDSTAAAGVPYYYMIKSADVEGNTSLPSYAQAFIKTIPSAPSGISASTDGSFAAVSWKANNAREGVFIYEVYRDSVFLGTASSNLFTDYTAALGGAYCYGVIAKNSEGASAPSVVRCIEIKPVAPVNLAAQRPAQGKVTVSWNALVSGVAIDGYNLYRADSTGVFPGTAQYEGITYTSVNEASLTPGELYYYKVAALSGGIEGYESVTISVRPINAPAEPSGFTGTAYSGYAVLSWDTAPEYDITAYDIFRATTFSAYARITSTSAAIYYDTQLVNGTVYNYIISAVNIFGASNTTNAQAVSVVPQAGILPFAPQNVTAVSRGDGKIALSWGRPAGNVSKYRVYRATAPLSGVFYQELTGTVLVDSIMNTSLSWSVTTTGNYYYSVSTVDSYGAESALSGEVSAVPFVRPSGVTGIELTDLNARVLIRWRWNGPVFTYGPGLKYNIYRSNTGLDGSYELRASGVENMHYVDSYTNTFASVMYYKVKSVDAMGNEDAAVNDNDFINLSPVLSAPAVLAARAGAGIVTLVWTVMTPQSFNVYRRTTVTAGGFGSPIAYNISFNVKEYEDRNVTNGIEYIYAVAAVNNAGEGPKSMTVSAAPYAPPQLLNGNTINAVIQNKKDVSLSWNEAVPGTYEIAGYRVLRSSDNGGSFSVLTQTSAAAYYDDSTQWDNRYIYRVLVVDSKNNTDTAYRNAVIELPRPGNRVRVFSNLVDFSKGETLKLRYFTIQKGKIRLSIKTLSGMHVGTIIEREHSEELSGLNPYESGDLFWDGKNRHGRPVAPGVYIIMLEAGGDRVMERVAVIR